MVLVLVKGGVVFLLNVEGVDLKVSILKVLNLKMLKVGVEGVNLKLLMLKVII